MGERPLTESQMKVLRYLAVVGHASDRRIRKETGALASSLITLSQRGFIEPYGHASYQITEAGRERGDH